MCVSEGFGRFRVYTFLFLNPVKLFVIDLWAVETEKFRAELAEVRAELEPWEKDLIEHKGKLEVACTEAKLLNDKVRMTLVFYALLISLGFKEVI